MVTKWSQSDHKLVTKSSQSDHKMVTKTIQNETFQGNFQTLWTLELLDSKLVFFVSESNVFLLTRIWISIWWVSPKWRNKSNKSESLSFCCQLGHPMASTASNPGSEEGRVRRFLHWRKFWCVDAATRITPRWRCCYQTCKFIEYTYSCGFTL